MRHFLGFGVAAVMALAINAPALAAIEGERSSGPNFTSNFVFDLGNFAMSENETLSATVSLPHVEDLNSFTLQTQVDVETQFSSSFNMADHLELELVASAGQLDGDPISLATFSDWSHNSNQSGQFSINVNDTFMVGELLDNDPDALTSLELVLTSNNDVGSPTPIYDLVFGSLSDAEFEAIYGEEFSWDGGVRVSMNTTLVPEPASAGLLALGSLVMLRRRRRAA